MKYLIRSVEQLQQTQEALGHVELALAYLREDILPINPRRYAMMAEGYIYHLRTLRAEINEYLGLTPADLEDDPVDSPEIHTAG